MTNGLRLKMVRMRNKQTWCSINSDMKEHDRGNMGLVSYGQLVWLELDSISVITVVWSCLWSSVKYEGENWVRLSRKSILASSW